MAKNHKWKEVTVLTNISRSHECVRCGINREWLYGDFQCWEYWWITPYANQEGTPGHTVHKTLHRPNCK